jgi:hypothetical protein
MYSSATQLRNMEDRCKNALAAKSKQNHLLAGQIMHGILSKLWTDWQGGILIPLPSQSFESSLIFFIDETCQLDVDVPCQVPTDIEGWFAGGPYNYAGAALNGPTGVLPSGAFAFRCDGCTNAFVTVVARPVTSSGPCPGNSVADPDTTDTVPASPHDCHGDVYDFEDFPDGSVTSWTAASCDDFGDLHMRCPGGVCVFGSPTVDATLTALLSCVETASLGEWRGLVYHATRPVQWFLRATPVIAAGGAATTFDGTSPIVYAEFDPRLREVVCSVTAGYNNGSEGTTCQLLDGATVYASCVTVADPDDSNAAECSMFPVVPDGGITLTPKAFKTGGGAFVQIGNAFTLEPDAPAPGESITVTFNLAPPGQQ